MSSNLITPQWGYFGKVPAKGDFIQESLPQDFLKSWQDWQQAVLAVSREQMEESWTQHYMNAPIWHFALSPNVCGENTVIGTMIPSVDSVGRYYFFTLARPVEGSAISYWQDRKWSEAAEDRALEVLDDNFQLEAWTPLLTNEHWEAVLTRSPVLKATPVNGEFQNLLFEEQIPLESNHLLQHLLKTQLPRTCYWWTEGSETIPAISTFTDGLPAVGQFAAMLDGNWDQWNW
ncbi:type VI secretion system protein ImpM [Vibrio nigripulchritudo ATCC 27043]|uniref:Phosphatase ImpM Type VI secretion system-associated n=2 Tax=Vibrio nigripulchritudo TaxID=28173 RepID=A0AAV2VIM5_9VIBR|nr:type VI secretion system-associated protein TagF [Vibrio nigripulchritudo]EGU51085.1 type VI secretion system protein ImpM [Vibrio nigripulchritudo ATCC 27043]KJY79747.1 type VI secretion system protein ImpM [Vibrio nigripulchritudo]CCN36831.1 putative phosphatase ImpM Type VI secretion system-associated [Vibrio nigripulchritudo AM115]CCN44607.1 putative phosphatase ImpM Type VI secretion system-associated [Vibrio nigripulchritudo FTn2]CCN66531.1 putative phosphatase ImpM Type VI secretion 